MSSKENQKSKSKGRNSKITAPRSLLPDLYSEAEACFLKAIEIARRQDAKLLELRATMSLVRLRQRQMTQQSARTAYHATRTRLNEAYEALSEVYNWFTEGFDTEDLQTAQTLLAEWTTSPQLVAQSREQKW